MSFFERTVKCPREGCGGEVHPCKKDGRFYTHRNIQINVPETFVIPKCDRCQRDVPLNDTLYVALTKVLEAEYQRHADLIKTVLARQKEAQ